MAIYFDKYINYFSEISPDKAFMNFGIDYLNTEMPYFDRLGLNVYQPGKWTVPDILQHLIDTERIFTNRALRFASHDNTLLPGFDENLFAENGHASERSCYDLLAEYELVRASMVALFNSFNEDDLEKEGMCFKTMISVMAIGFTIVGHPMHHLLIIKKKYFTLNRIQGKIFCNIYFK